MKRKKGEREKKEKIKKTKKKRKKMKKKVLHNKLIAKNFAKILADKMKFGPKGSSPL